MYPPPPVPLPAKAMRGKLHIYSHLNPLPCKAGKGEILSNAKDGGKVHVPIVNLTNFTPVIKMHNYVFRNCRRGCAGGEA